MLCGGHDSVGAVYCRGWPGLTVPVDYGHPPPVGDVSDEAQPLSGPAAVEPALSQVPARRDEENIVQAGCPSLSTAGSALVTGGQSGPWLLSLRLTLQAGRLMWRHTSWISAVLSAASSSQRQLEFP